MQLTSFRIDGRDSYGIMAGDTVREAAASLRDNCPDLRALIAAGKTDALATTAGATYSVDDIEFLPPITVPGKVLCVGVNYRPHIEEMGRAIPQYPVVFVRFPASQAGHGQAIIRPAVSTQFDFEGELAFVIGARGRYIRRQNAFDHIAGYCCFMDGTIRDWQKHTPQFTAGKNFHHSGSMGPCLVTRDEIPDPTRLSLVTRVNDEVMQEGRVSDLVFDIPTLIEYCSTFAELCPGDVIATGTPGGVGAARTPPVWLRPGDRVEVAIPGVGVLCNHVADEGSA